MRLFFESWSPFFLMYAHSLLVTSVRGRGFEPTTSASAGLGVIGFMKAALGLRADFFALFAVRLVADLRAPLAAVFFALFALFLAICSPLNKHWADARPPRVAIGASPRPEPDAPGPLPVSPHVTRAILIEGPKSGRLEARSAGYSFRS
jgi:hypothetical protein